MERDGECDDRGVNVNKILLPLIGWFLVPSTALGQSALGLDYGHLSGIDTVRLEVSWRIEDAPELSKSKSEKATGEARVALQRAEIAVFESGLPFPTDHTPGLAILVTLSQVHGARMPSYMYWIRVELIEGTKLRRHGGSCVSITWERHSLGVLPQTELWKVEELARDHLAVFTSQVKEAREADILKNAAKVRANEDEKMRSSDYLDGTWRIEAHPFTPRADFPRAVAELTVENSRVSGLRFPGTDASLDVGESTVTYTSPQLKLHMVAQFPERPSNHRTRSVPVFMLSIDGVAIGSGSFIGTMETVGGMVGGIQAFRVPEQARTSSSSEGAQATVTSQPSPGSGK